MDHLLPIEVECYAGYKADEYPVRFFMYGLKFEIAEILDRWYQGERSPDFPPANYYKVVAKDGKIYILKHATEEDRWYLLTKGESMHLHNH